MVEVTLRDPVESDAAAWRELWDGYCAFYQTVVPAAVSAETWRRLLNPAVPLLGRLAEQDGTVLGFAVAVLHLGTWTTAPVCYLEDLFVAPPARGRGYGRALLEDIVALARGRGCSRLYWHTRRDNATARQLYDRFGAADDFVRYRLFLDA